MLFWNLLFFVGACIVLVKSSSWLLRAVVKISAFFHVTEFTIGFMVIAISASVPELFVGIMSALNGVPTLSMGNVIGSNILEMTIVIGIAVLLAKRIKLETKTVKKDLIYMQVILILPVLLFIDHKFWNLFGLFPNMIQGISRLDGLALLGVFGYYIFGLVKQEKSFHKEFDKTTKHELLRSLFMFMFSIILLLISSDMVVTYANQLSVDIGISNILMGLFIVALGTSLPDLMMETRAVLKHHEGIAIGELIGSVICNSTLVVGVTALIAPIQGEFFSFFTSSMFMVLTGFLFLTFAESDSELTWREGLSLIFLYIFFLIVETYLRSVV